MSILVTLIAPLPLLLLLECAFLFRSGKQWRTAILFHVAIIAIISYYYMPKGESDLARYLVQIENCKNWTLLETYNKFYDGLFFIETLYWIAAKLSIPHIVPMISTCTVYAIAMYITSDYANRISAKKSLWKVILFQICMFHLLYIVNNIRNVFAFSVAMLAIYRDLVQEKKNVPTWILYIVPLFIHRTAAIFIFIRLCLLIARRSRALMLGIALGVPTAISVLYNNIDILFAQGAVGYYLRNLIYGGYRYLHGNEHAWVEVVARSGYQQVSRAMWIIFTVVVVIHLYMYLRDRKDNYARFVFLFALITLVFSITIIDDAYWRFSTATALAYSPILLTSIKPKFNRRRPLASVLTISLIPIVLARIVMHVYYDRYLVEYAEYLPKIFFSDGLRVVGEILYNAFRMLR